MPRPNSTVHYELSDAEKRDIIALIEKGKPLPDKYRFLLFEDKREVELIWNGKTRDVTTAILPFQTLEHIDEPRKEQSENQELGFDTRGRQLKGWTNKLIWGDNKLILSSLKGGALRRQIEDAGGLKLIYIDPPFDVGADFSMDIEIGGETFHKEPNILEQIAYRDTWGRGADSFIAMLYERLILMRDVMANDSSIYVHCDYRVNSIIRLALDEVFGTGNFQNEIIWQQTRAKSTGFKNFGLEHNSIYSYRKNDNYTWNLQYKDYDEDKFDRYYCYFEQPNGKFIKYSKAEMQGFRKTKKYPPGKQFALIPLQRSMDGERPNLTYEFRGFLETWSTTKDKMIELEKKGIIVQTSPSSIPQRKQYLDDMEGVKVGTIWDDIYPVNSQAKEKVDYPTQKPEGLIERIIQASSNEGDLVADFFCGSGTTAAVAEKLGRKWLATDLGKFGIHTTRKRLIQTQRELKEEGKNFRAFEVLNLGRYERQAYLNVSGRLTSKQKQEALAKKENEFRELILRAYKAEETKGADKFFHGKKGNRLVVIGPINLPVGRLFVEEVIIECRKRHASRVDLLAFEYEMGLFPATLEEAKNKGIDIAPKIIPPEVFDKRAVEKGQVRFYDVAYVEATPRYSKQDKHEVRVELTDFSVHYSQGIAESITDELKEGKSEVICNDGMLVKLSKDKEGVVVTEALTKHWTDWIDYWAIDFNFESRKEIVQQPVNMGLKDSLDLVDTNEFVTFEDRWTGSYIFENEWQSFRTKKSRELELLSASHRYDKPGRYVIAVKVIDIFGNDTTATFPVTVG